MLFHNEMKKRASFLLYLIRKQTSWMPLEKRLKPRRILKQLRNNLAKGETGFEWAVRDGLILLRGKVYLLPTSPLVHTILLDIYDMAHEGIQKTLQRVHGDFF